MLRMNIYIIDIYKNSISVVRITQNIKINRILPKIVSTMTAILIDKILIYFMFLKR